MKKKTKVNPPRNFVAKNAAKFNHAVIMRDKKHDYKRNPKHKSEEE